MEPEYRWRVIDTERGEIHESSAIYDLAYLAELAMSDFVREELFGKSEAFKFEIIKSPSGKVERVIKKGHVNDFGEVLEATEFPWGGGSRDYEET